MAKDDIDFDKELKRLSRNIDIDIMKSENSFDNLFEKMDKEIDNAVSNKISAFDESKELTSKHIMTNYTDSALERYKRKLDKI